MQAILTDLESANEYPFGFPEPNKKESRNHDTTEAIKKYIFENNLKPGQILPTESSLCESLGVSRSSVREGLRKLEALDVIKVKHGKGTYVAEMTMRPLIETLIFRTSLLMNDSNQALEEIFNLRKILDFGSCNEVVKAYRGKEAKELFSLVEAMERKAIQGESFIREDIAFHRALMAPLNNVLLDQMVSAMWLVHMSLVPKLGQNQSDLQATACAHRQMLEAAISGDRRAYRAALFAHYQPLERILYEASWAGE